MWPRKPAERSAGLPGTWPAARNRLRALVRRLARTARLAVGIPDYDGYVAHRRAHHPGEPLMSYEEFFRERLAARYRRGGSRCC